MPEHRHRAALRVAAEGARTTTSSATCAGRSPASAPWRRPPARSCATSTVGRAHRRHAGRARRRCSPPARRPDHDAREPVPDAHLANAREMLRDVKTVIIDEVHAMAATKRGAHLALSLERLVGARADAGAQRVALSATQRPLEEVARFVGGDRPRHDRRRRRAQGARPRGASCRSRTWPTRPPSRTSPPSPLADVQGATDGGARSIWPAIYPELLRAGEHAPLDADVRQQPPARGAPRAAAERARRGSRSPVPTTDRSRARRAARSRRR